MNWITFLAYSDDLKHAQVFKLIQHQLFIVVVGCFLHVWLDASHIPAIVLHYFSARLRVKGVEHHSPNRYQLTNNVPMMYHILTNEALETKIWLRNQFIWCKGNVNIKTYISLTLIQTYFLASRIHLLIYKHM